MNKPLLVLLLSTSLISTSLRPLSAPSEVTTRKMMLGLLLTIGIYYEALAKPTDAPPAELDDNASILGRLWHYLRYDVLGQQERKIGYKLELNGNTGRLKETKIKATKLGKLYVALKNCARLLSLPAVLIGISKSLEAYDIKPHGYHYVVPTCARKT